MRPRRFLGLVGGVANPAFVGTGKRKRPLNRLRAGVEQDTNGALCYSSCGAACRKNRITSFQSRGTSM